MTFENLVPFLKKDGVYFIEDVWPMHKMSKKELKHPWLLTQSDRYDMLKHDLFMSALDTYHTTHYDRRKETNWGDTYVISIKHTCG